MFLSYLSTITGELVGASRKFRTDFLQEWPTPGTGPYFDTASIPSNITGLVGKTVLLICKVKNLGNRTVSANRLSYSFNRIPTATSTKKVERDLLIAPYGK